MSDAIREAARAEFEKWFYSEDGPYFNDMPEEWPSHKRASFAAWLASRGLLADDGKAVAWGVRFHSPLGGASTFAQVHRDRKDADASPFMRLAGYRVVPLYASPVAPPRESTPEIVCLCGSTRFIDAFSEHYGRLTDEGKIVLSVGRVVPQSEQALGSSRKVMLDELHKRKIDLADRVFVLNVGGYVGSSTRSEIEYATAHGKPIDYLEPGAIHSVPPAESTPAAPVEADRDLTREGFWWLAEIPDQSHRYIADRPRPPTGYYTYDANEARKWRTRVECAEYCDDWSKWAEKVEPRQHGFMPAPVEAKAPAKDVDKDAGCVCGRTGIEPHIPYGCSLSIPPRTAETPVERARREFVDVVRDAMASAYLSATGIPAHPTLTATSLDAIDAANQRLLAAERAERGGHRE